MLFREIFFICFGYLLGSILFARLFGLLFAHKDITQNTADGNPGTANAFCRAAFSAACVPCSATFLRDIFRLRGICPPRASQPSLRWRLPC